MARRAGLKTLFVGETAAPSPILLSAIRAAFVAVLGEAAVPSDDAFARFLAARGCQLVGLADVPTLAEQIAVSKPKHIVVIKRDIAADVEAAVALSGLKNVGVLVLAYPIRQWRTVFIRDLAAYLTNVLPSVRSAA